MLFLFELQLHLLPCDFAFISFVEGSSNFVYSSLRLFSSFIWFLLVHLCIVGDILQLKGYFFLYFDYIFSLVLLLLLSYWSFIKLCLLLLVV